MGFEDEIKPSGDKGKRPSAALVDAPRGFHFGSKAQTLERIARESSCRVLPIHRITYSDWCLNRNLESRRAIARFEGSLMIVRSCATVEDGRDNSHAGEFDSVLNVSEAELNIAIDRVFRSYGSVAELDEVLIQPMASNLVCSGVAMTCDPLTGAPYFVVNYQEGSNTEAVTAGHQTSSWSMLQGRDIDLPELASRVVDALEDLMAVTNERHLDVEFGVDTDLEVIVFQVRRITTVDSSRRATQRRDARLTKAVDRAFVQYRTAQRHARHLGFDRSLLGVMPDWNPAELIGLKPRPLAFSLYESIITSDAWAVGRYRLGYKNLRAVPLMHRVGGTPYILVAASLLSFVPDQVPEGTARQIVDVAQEHLRAAPELHDKVEFAVMPTCFKPSLRSGEWRDRFAPISDQEWTKYLEELLRLTNDVIGDERVMLSAPMRAAKLEDAAKRMRSEVDGSESTVDAVALLRAARVHGTELFSEVARAAFIATDILTDLEKTEVLAEGTLDGIVGRASTIGSRLVEDHSALSVEDFLLRHGHIRPGTYDVTVPRYDAAPNSYFHREARTLAAAPRDENQPSEDIDRVLADAGYTFSWEQLVAFARVAIALREEVKHSFTKLLSDAMEILVRGGAGFDLGRDDVSFLTLADLAHADEFPNQRPRFLTRAVDRNRKQWRHDLAVRLPHLLTEEREILFNEERVSRPTFVTQKRVQGRVRTPNDAELQGSVIFIERADPGYDWLFTHDIAGFVTRFGGENSHMAIRARELDIPAVIGAGSQFERWSLATRILIDGQARTVEVLA
ncbi:PEP-utilizing enzyme [Leifsonia sp. NPDC056665]|uniref:PEP-utilizing enzyme n=1 Tax=Leifsonia sp. NPDC056665 TaxID=3345901 RepID=UPI0036CB4249